ncbi:hypothetical protein [Polaromonas sp. SM01]|uniref:hypothetical protein n=1 Tax=Polaromonas sp. SM01 TaxID=3085630 RepID=UPI002981DAA0|nr:hypothetical protein [Polaromonas sp. SM01]MDW5441979.1 hypothetical protein [Polaromonas sp. SM01]
MTKNIDTLISFVASQMDGEQVPPASSAAFNQISEAVGAVQRGSDKELQALGLRVMGAIIDRVRANIAAEKALHTFITGGDHA